MGFGPMGLAAHRKSVFFSVTAREGASEEILDELNRNLKEVVELLLEDGEPELETEFVGTQSVVVA